MVARRLDPVRRARATRRRESIQDWSQYPELRWLDRNHWVPGVLLAVLCFFFGVWTAVGGAACLVWGFVVSTVLLYHATFTINSLCHLFGSRRYDTRDDSRNNWFLALITLGEGWHNNHHHYQSSANQGFFWWEIDISYYILRAVQPGSAWCGTSARRRRPSSTRHCCRSQRKCAGNGLRVTTPLSILTKCGSLNQLPVLR